MFSNLIEILVNPLYGRDHRLLVYSADPLGQNPSAVRRATVNKLTLIPELSHTLAHEEELSNHIRRDDLLTHDDRQTPKSVG